MLEQWAKIARTSGLGRRPTTTVDVLVPSYRADVPLIESMMRSSLDSARWINVLAI